MKKETNSAPHALQEEESVLGCILANPDNLYEATAILRPDDFYLHKHRWVWDALCKLNNAQMPLDITTVADELDRQNQLGEVGGTAYLARLITAPDNTTHVEGYARIIKRESVRRKLLEAAAEIAKTAYDYNLEIDGLTSQANSILMAVAENSSIRQGKTLKVLASEYYNHLAELMKNPNAFRGTPSGLIDLDKLLGGLRGSELAIVAGRPGSGKTALMLTIAREAAKLDKRIAFYSLEMGELELANRLVAQEGEINSNHLKRGALVDDEHTRMVSAINELGQYNVVVDDTPALSVAQLRSKSSKLHMEDELDLIIIDYLQLMQGGDGKKWNNRVEEVSHISRGLKMLSKELNVPVLAGAQLSRAIEHRQDKRPVLADLRESGSIEQDSDIVMFITPEDSMAEIGVSVLMVAKNRGGPVGDVPLIFDKPKTIFRNAITREVSF